ncbi:MAG: hypothetical protein R3286_14385 [Gammaproteobacteria bacterium]|nr:hypothetical protein [Gammaproteobacteria bacterium]
MSQATSMPSTLARAAAVAAESSGWMACTFDGVTLLLPRVDVATRVELGDLAPASGDGPSVGAIEWRDGSWPVYRLDRELRVGADAESNATLAVLVFARGVGRGLVCEQVRTLDAPAAVTPHAMPGCLRNPASPIAALGLYETLRVGLVTRGEDLIHYIDTALGAARR